MGGNDEHTDMPFKATKGKEWGLRVEGMCAIVPTHRVCVQPGATLREA